MSVAHKLIEPTVTVRKSMERGHENHGWLDTFHTFSFADYFNPHFMGYRALRVINEDRIEPRQGFPMHSHRDMEILTYVVSGALAHRDSIGNGSIITPGELQRMSAGTGIRHSEANASEREPLHLLQIWIVPDLKNLLPGYEQKRFEDREKEGRLRLLASMDGREGSLTVHQDVDLHSALLSKGALIDYAFSGLRYVWLQVIKGSLIADGQVLEAGDGAAVVGGGTLRITGNSEAPTEFLLFDLA